MKSRCVPQKLLSIAQKHREFCLITMDCSEIKQDENGLYYFEIGEE